jgi:hypothetical protein
MVLTPPFAARARVSTTHVATRISVGANLARTLNAKANGSPYRSHVLRPNKSIPIQVIAENPIANHASRDGIDRPSHTSSIQAKAMNNPVAGQTPKVFGQPILAPRRADWIEKDSSYHSNNAAHGLMTHHILPTKADRYENPTHHAIQIAVGARFRVGIWSPNIPATTITISAPTAKSRAMKRNARPLITLPVFHRSRFTSAGASVPGFHRMKIATKKNDNKTVEAAPMIQSSKGSGRS